MLIMTYMVLGAEFKWESFLGLRSICLRYHRVYQLLLVQVELWQVGL